MDFKSAPPMAFSTAAMTDFASFFASVLASWAGSRQAVRTQPMMTLKNNFLDIIFSIISPVAQPWPLPDYGDFRRKSYVSGWGRVKAKWLAGSVLQLRCGHSRVECFERMRDLRKFSLLQAKLEDQLWSLVGSFLGNSSEPNVSPAVTLAGYRQVRLCLLKSNGRRQVLVQPANFRGERAQLSVFKCCRIASRPCPALDLHVGIKPICTPTVRNSYAQMVPINPPDQQFSHWVIGSLAADM